MENISVLTAAFILSILMGRLIIPNILIISIRKKLFDQPDERKVHHRPIPRLGGVTFFPVIVFTFSVFTALRIMLKEIPNDLFSANTACEFLFLIAGLTLLYIIGIADDLMGVRYRKKFFVQIISASLFPISGLYINNLYGLFGINEIAAWIGIPLTILLVVFITNAINLIDGIDGLASGLSMVALIIFGVIFIHHDFWNLSMLAFISIGVIIPFFAYNVFGNEEKGRKIFMGDTGSLTLGFILSFFVLKYCMFVDGVHMQSYGSPIVVAFSMLLVPSLDVVRVVLKRLRNKKALFMPDKTHIHHKFLDMGFSARRALVSIQAMSASFCIFSFIAVQYMNNTAVFVIDIIAWTLLNIWFDRVIEKRKKLKSQNNE